MDRLRSAGRRPVRMNRVRKKRVRMKRVARRLVASLAQDDVGVELSHVLLLAGASLVSCVFLLLAWLRAKPLEWPY